MLPPATNLGKLAGDDERHRIATPEDGVTKATASPMGHPRPGPAAGGSTAPR